MKAKLHPTYYHDAVATCACGETFTTGSTQKEIKVELCSACHPFFTGEMKFVDTMGRVEKFQKQQKQAAKVKKTKKIIKKKQVRPETLREMMIREKRKLAKKEQQSKAPPQKTSSKTKQ